MDDSAEDASLKASSTEHAHLANHWPCHGSELRKLLHALFGWRAEQPNREVIFFAFVSWCFCLKNMRHYSFLKLFLGLHYNGQHAFYLLHFLFFVT